MRIVKCEKIYLSQNEADTWTAFEQMLESIERTTENPEMKTLIGNIQSYLIDLWNETEEIE